VDKSLMQLHHSEKIKDVENGDLGLSGDHTLPLGTLIFLY
jgi:hypothetical protein